MYMHTHVHMHTKMRKAEADCDMFLCKGSTRACRTKTVEEFAGIPAKARSGHSIQEGEFMPKSEDQGPS